MGPRPALADEVRFAVDVTREAGRLTLDWFRRADLRVDRKTDGSVVTDADHAAERLIRDRLAARFPGDSVIGEEGDDRPGGSGRTWVIDPIDGTKAFTQGVPLYSTLLALIDEDGPVIGVAHLPGLDETVSAGRGLGAHHNGAPCRVSDRTALAGSYVCTSGFSYWPRHQLDRALDAGVNIRTWGDAYGYVLVATGRAEAMIDPACSGWDVAPMAVIIPEAGGVFSDATGDPSWSLGSGVASNGPHHADYLAWLAD
jgi:histidinol phosphatase-like enzyme (inositol monophosphatase family)